MPIVRFAILFFLAGVLLSTPARAEIYKYVDSNGVCHYTNAPVDSRYKKVNLHTRSRKPTVSRRSYPQVRLFRRRGRGAFYSFDYHIIRAARAHRVDPLLIKAIIKTESNFNPRAVSSRGALGLMQLMPATARELRVRNPLDAKQNIDGGTRYIKQLLDSFHGNVPLSLAAYNAGPGRIKNGMIPAIPETISYVKKVLRLYKTYRRARRTSASITISHVKYQG